MTAHNHIIVVDRVSVGRLSDDANRAYHVYDRKGKLTPYRVERLKSGEGYRLLCMGEKHWPPVFKRLSLLREYVAKLIH